MAPTYIGESHLASADSEASCNCSIKRIRDEGDNYVDHLCCPICYEPYDISTSLRTPTAEPINEENEFETISRDGKSASFACKSIRFGDGEFENIPRDVKYVTFSRKGNCYDDGEFENISRLEQSIASAFKGNGFDDGEFEITFQNEKSETFNCKSNSYDEGTNTDVCYDIILGEKDTRDAFIGADAPARRINEENECDTIPRDEKLETVNCESNSDDDAANSDAIIGEKDTCGLRTRHQDCDVLHFSSSTSTTVSTTAWCAEIHEANPIHSARGEYRLKNLLPRTHHHKQDNHRKNNDISKNLSRKHPRERVTIPGCEHEFCRGCLEDHCSHSISVRNVPIRCPTISAHEGSFRHCPVFLPTDLVEDLLLSSTKDDEKKRDNNDRIWIKFQRLRRMSEDPSLIPCTRCDELISPDDISNDEDPSRIRCVACRHVFCRVHGDDVYSPLSGTKLHDENSVRKRQEEESENAIRELCKPCSHCGTQLLKEDGCDHVVCPLCKNDMCFRCGTHEHLKTSESSEAFRTCQACKKTYLDHRHLWRHRMRMLAKLPLMLPVYLFYVIMTLSLAVATGGCFCCLGCGVRYKTIKTNAKEKGKSNSKSSLVWMPLMAMKEVLGWVLEPLIDMFHDFGLACCFCNDSPGLCKGGVMDDVDDDPYYYSEAESEYTSDIESQTIRR